ncbi:MAG: preprotein translocase subunit SecE [Verrucomicrobia bacterium]|nr:MAG: preprotein translocase subunit SecE [Verrucomicrobiota bacterium]
MLSVKKIREIPAAVARFAGEVKVELQKCVWPTRPELLGSTVVVITATLILAVYVGASDALIAGVLRYIIR